MTSSSNHTDFTQTSSSHDAELKLALQTEASEHMSKGLAAYANQDFETAVMQLSQGVSLIEQIYGPMSILTADALFNYGRALLENGVKNMGLLGDKQVAKEDEKKEEDAVSENELEEEDDEDEQAPDMSRKIFSFEADIDLSDKDFENSDEAEISGDQAENSKAEDDFDLAWQSFESARVIYTHHLEQPSDVSSSSANPPPMPANVKKIQHKLGEVLLALGDLSLESENFQQAIADYQQAVKVKQQCLEPHDRRIAEAIYKLAVAYEYLPDRPQAKAHLISVTEVLEAHIASLDAQSHASEIREIKDLLQEIKLKLEELDAPQPDLGPELAKDLVKPAREGGFEGPQEKARDVNTLVKRKRTTESSEISEKRQCS